MQNKYERERQKQDVLLDKSHAMQAKSKFPSAPVRMQRGLKPVASQTKTKCSNTHATAHTHTRARCSMPDLASPGMLPLVDSVSLSPASGSGKSVAVFRHGTTQRASGYCHNLGRIPVYVKASLRFPTEFACHLLLFWTIEP